MESLYNTKSNSITPFVGPASYSENHKDLFYGRSKEINILYSKILRTTLTLFYGLSGSGKSSLLNAGVMPLLRDHYCLPFRIRLIIPCNDLSLLNQVKQSINEQIKKYDFKPEKYIENESLWKYFQSEHLWNYITPILIFDQFEDIFSFSSENDLLINEVSELFKELSDLIDNSIPEKIKDEMIEGTNKIDFNYNKPKAKVLFCFREEFLPEIEDWTSKLLSENRTRFRLKRMNGHQAEEVINRSWNGLIQQEQTDSIIQYLTNVKISNLNRERKNDQYKHLVIEPSLLSHVITRLDEIRLNNNVDYISDHILNRYPKDQILNKFYNDGISKCKRPYAIKEFIEEYLVSNSGTRSKYPYTNIDKYLLEDLQSLFDYRIIRREGDYVELIHDVIVPLIIESREERRKSKLFLEARLQAINKSKEIEKEALEKERNAKLLETEALALETQARANELETKLLKQEAQAYELETKLLNQQAFDLKNKARIRNKKLLIYTLSIGIFISILIIGSSYVYYQDKVKEYDTLIEEKSRINEALELRTITLNDTLSNLNSKLSKATSDLNIKEKELYEAIDNTQKTGNKLSNIEKNYKKIYQRNIELSEKLNASINSKNALSENYKTFETQNTALRATLSSFYRSIPAMKNNIQTIKENNDKQIRFARQLNEDNAIIRTLGGQFPTDPNFINKLRDEIRTLIQLSMEDRDETEILEREIERLSN